NGVGAVTPKDISTLSQKKLEKIRKLTEDLANFWGAVEATKDIDRRAVIIDRHAKHATKAANELITMIGENGLHGPYYS
ncbi:MAG: hypothetical protein GY742_07990, partial [Hyphomicrobiales bacterium]|nr:hypothetical protein [Hyphomicrobiales bacterium]